MKGKPEVELPESSMATIASPESHDLLVRRLGYQLDEFRDWMEHTLIQSILRPPR